MDIKPNEFLWSQKYRPQKIADAVLPEELKKTLQGYVDKGELQTMLFYGPPGVGKTTAALAMCEQVGCDVLMINGSEESGIDTLRTKVMGFATTVSLTDSKKMIIIDEADGLNPNSFQPALKATMESVSANCRFILTANHKGKIIEPIHSRSACFDFKIPAAEKPKLAMGMLKRIQEILDTEGVAYDKKVVAELVTKYFPDFRRTLNELQRYAVNGTIDSGILVNLSDETYKELIGYMKNKKFPDVRKWVGKNSDVDSTHLFRHFYDQASNYLDPKTIPQLILILADYQHKAAFVADQEINIMAAMTEIMSSVEWK
jgi:DNA polymerase III delta prime subunit